MSHLGALNVMPPPSPSEPEITLGGTPFDDEASDRTIPLRQDHVDQLMQQGFSTGLAHALATNANSFDHRIWVIDNSGSMKIPDGHRLTEGSKKEDIHIVPATRWEELQDTINYHCQMAALLDTPTKFRLINNPGVKVGPQEFGIAEHREKSIDEEIRVAMKVMKRTSPSGVTPLTRHIRQIQEHIQKVAPQLRKAGKQVAIVLATDGTPSDDQGYGGDHITEDFIRALRSLEGLPIWLVVRLCTDEEPVTNFYNNLDGQLEISLEVLDDFINEAKEVHKFNNWINYGLPMHRCRELGYHDRLFDLIDERALTKGELHEFCVLLFGPQNTQDLADPGADWKGFIKRLQVLLANESMQWNPMKKKVMPWISIKKLHKAFGEKPDCTIS